MSFLSSAALDLIAERCVRARSALFITGAGISAESGLPTYRGVGGLYNYGETEEGLPIEELLSGRMLAKSPAVCWKYIHQIERACRGAAPNRAHEIIAAFESRFPRTCVLTQNVDGLHKRAGSTHVIEIHGDIHKLGCTACDYRTEVEDYSALAPLPLCPRCGGVVRPCVVLFGEMLPEAAIDTLEHELERGFDVIFSIGTTSVFPYIRAPVIAGRQRKALTIEINPEETEASRFCEHRLRARAGETLCAIWDRIAH